MRAALAIFFVVVTLCWVVYANVDLIGTGVRMVENVSRTSAAKFEMYRIASMLRQHCVQKGDLPSRNLVSVLKAQLGTGSTPFDEQQPIKIQQRITQCHLALEPAGLHIQCAEPLPLVSRLRRLQQRGDGLAKPSALTALVAPQRDSGVVHGLEVVEHCVRALEYLFEL